MMVRRRSYSLIYNVQRIILLVFYTTTMIGLSIPLARGVVALSPNNLFPLVAVLVLYMVLVIVLGSFINLLSYIPFNLATAFDPIKNEIAAGRISDMKQLGESITRFITSFFDFSFLDIEVAFMETEGSGLISHEDLSGISQVLETFGMLEKSRNLEEITRAGRITHAGRNYHLYILPIWIGEDWLGYLGLLSRNRIGRLFQGILMEFEDNFVDDQVLYVKRMSQRH